MHYQPSGCQMIIKNLILFINLTPSPFVPLPFYCGVRQLKLHCLPHCSGGPEQYQATFRSH